MSSEKYYFGVSHVVSINTNTFNDWCDLCKAKIDGATFAESINHYLQTHDYKLLHAGQETTHDPKGNPWHNTVALLGK